MIAKSIPYFGRFGMAGHPDLPPSVLAAAKWWADYRPHGQPGELAQCPRDRPHRRGQAAADCVPRAGRCRIHGRRGQRFGRHHVWGRQRADPQAGAPLRRQRDHLAPRIGLAAVEWASAFVMHQTRRIATMAAGHVADNPFHAECLAVEKLRAAPGELPHSVLAHEDGLKSSMLIETLVRRETSRSRPQPNRAGRLLVPLGGGESPGRPPET